MTLFAFQWSVFIFVFFMAIFALLVKCFFDAEHFSFGFCLVALDTFDIPVSIFRFMVTLITLDVQVGVYFMTESGRGLFRLIRGQVYF